MNDVKVTGVNNPKRYILTHNRFNTYMLLIFDDLNRAQIYKMPNRVSLHEEIKILMSFDYLNVLKPNEHTQDYHIRTPNDENFLFHLKDNEYIYVGDRVISFETDDVIVEYSSEHGLNDIKFPFARGEKKNYFMLHKKYITIEEYKNSTKKDEYRYLY